MPSFRLPKIEKKFGKKVYLDCKHRYKIEKVTKIQDKAQKIFTKSKQKYFLFKLLERKLLSK